MYELVMALLITYSTPHALPPKQLANEILRVAYTHHIDPVQLTKIVLVESGGVPGRYNARTRDHGLMQINQRTAKSRKLAPACLYDWKCNLEAGAAILAELQRHPEYRPCWYNTGAAGSKRNNGKNCLHYQKKLDRLVLIQGGFI